MVLMKPALSSAFCREEQPSNSSALARVGEQPRLPTPPPGCGLHNREQYCTLGLVVSDLPALCAESHSKQPPHGPRGSPCCSAHQFAAGAALQNCAAEPAVRPELPCAFLSGCGPAPPLPEASTAHGQREQCRGCRLQQPWHGSHHSRATGDKNEPQRAPFCAAGPKMPGTVASEHISLSNRNKFFQRSATARLYRTEGNF